LQHQKKWNNHPGHFHFLYLIFKLFVRAQKANDQVINPWFQKLLGLISNPDKVRKSEREKQSFSTRQYQEHVFQFDLEKHINLKTLYLFSASVELQSFRFLNPKTPFLAQYSDPTVPRSTVKFKSTSIGFRQTIGQSQRPSEFVEFTEFFF
jgi:hypothetical protein